MGQVHLEPSSISALDQTHTAIAFGNLEYKISFTGLDRSLYTDQLTQFSKPLKYTGHTPGSFLDPTPADTDYMVMGKYNIKDHSCRVLLVGYVQLLSKTEVLS